MTDPADRDRAAVAGLARDLEALRRQLEDLGALREQVNQLAATVATLADTLSGTLSGPAPDGLSSPPAPSWLAFRSEVDDPAAAAAARDLLATLADWVRGVYLRYEDGAGRFPDCWLWHPDVVEELLWLRSAWLTAYAPGAPRTAVGDWHDRQRPMVVRRIRDHAGHCALEQHQLRGHKYGTPPAVAHTDAIDAIAQWWVTRRAEPAPIPTPDQLSIHPGFWRRGGGGTQ